jgi:hypothetical protein
VRTSAEALQEHGFTGEQLLGLARKAANDALRRHAAHLDQQRFEELADYLLEVGCRCALRYEPGHGIAIQTYLYRIMRRRYVDWLRLTLGDNRYGKTGVQRRSKRIPPGKLFALDELRDGPCWEDGYEEVEERLSAALESGCQGPSKMDPLRAG